MNKRYGSVNNWLIDLPSGSILHLVTGERKRLGEYQLKLLNVLMQDAGKIFTREELTNLVWERRVIGNNSLPNAVHALRTALEDDGKKQKIIKTIPRKGYVLEPEYCCFVEKDEAEVDDADCDAELPEEDDSAGLPPVENDESDSEAEAGPGGEKPVAQPASHKQRYLIFALLLLIVSFVSMMFADEFTKHHQGTTLEAEEIQANVYSNIHLYALKSGNNPTGEHEHLYSKLKGTLYTLNQQLRPDSVTMNVYFLSENQTLNYTFTLHSPCDDKQLVMTLYHWRIDPLKLNNLILRETRRKLSEMADCKES
ncbi:transcriptional regulator [Enterobacteriaceae bacterium 89]|nr:transcriptional regulator [Enterobacteriaceae bacterium 89]